LSKVNAIRKKALECVRKQNWQGATKEYKRLADLDQSNPNVFNELGDIYLKTGNKTEAYDAFSRAIDSYTRVSLHNNAVAVCKKVLRLIPARFEILIKLGLIRKKQGLVKEAESYYYSYFDKVLVDQQASPADVKKSCDEIVEEMTDSAPVLERVYECLVKFNVKEESGEVLQNLYRAYHADNNQEELERTRERLAEIGVDPPQVAVAVKPNDKEGAIITEDNIWSAAHTEGERIDVDHGAKTQDGLTPMGPSGGNPDSVYEYGDLEMDPKQPAATHDGGAAPVAPGAPEGADPSQSPQVIAGAAPETPVADPQSEDVPSTATQTAPEPPSQSPDAAVHVPEAGAPTVDPDTGASVYDIAADETEDAGRPEWDITPDEQPQTAGQADTPAPERSSSPGIPGSPEQIHVSAIVDGLDTGEDGEASQEDYRSHYDLGMAYLEMDLLPEAIREYQFAAKSPDYQARALEMIGLCFLKQNQAHLAIKQLRKGLQVIGDGDIEGLGIKYNLGLAYEMAGDSENAKSAFEDVYVEDVTFREVAKKIEKYS
jgi:tetratricopeptide (TPR) repeat protein